MTIMQRAAAVLVAVVVTLIGAALVTLGLALYSTTMASWMVGMLSERVPGELAIGRVDGSLARGLVLADVTYTAETVHAELEELTIEPSLAAAARGRLELTRLTARTGSVTLRSANGAQAPAEPFTLPRIPEPLAIRELELADVRLDAFGTDVAIATAAGTLAGRRLELRTVQLNAAGAAAASSVELLADDDGIRGSIQSLITLGAASSNHRSGPSTVELDAEVALDAAGGAWRAAVDWTRLAWRGSPIGDLDSLSGRTVLTPRDEGVGIELAAEAAGEALPDTVSIAAQASVDGERLELREVTAATLGGRLTAHGELELASPSGTLHVAARDLDPARIDERLAGRIGGDIEITLASEPMSLTAAGGIDGELHGRELDGQVRGTYTNGTIAVERAYVRLDGGSVQLDGTFAPASVDVRFEADVPQIAAWYPPVHGTLAAFGSARGAARDALIEASIASRGFAVAGAAVPPLDELAAGIHGTLAAHTVTLHGRGAVGELRAELAQEWSTQALRGRLLRSTLAIERAGLWTLTAPAEYALGAGTARIEPLCYAGPGGGRLCGTLRDTQLSVTADGLPSQLAEPWLPATIELAGAADAELELDWRGSLQGTMWFRQPSLIVSTAGRPQGVADEVSGEASSIEIVNVEVTAALDRERLQTRLAAAFAGTEDRIDAELSLTPPDAEGALAGRLVGSLSDLALLEKSLSGLNDVTGTADMDVSLGGSAAAPTVRGSLRARSLRASLPSLGIEVSGELSATAGARDEIAFDGKLCAAGCVTLEGALNAPLQPSWRLEAALTGDGFKAVELPTLRATMAPNLMLAASGNEWRVTGTVDVDDAAARVTSAPRTAIRPAPETVVHGRAASAPDNAARLPVPLVADVRAHLGAVQFEGLGVAAELGGTLDLQRTAQGLLRVRGTAAVEDGTFRAYGQEFAIERGLLIFTGAPDDPSLDIRATREVDGARVGLAITGTADMPRSEVFADTAMSESEAFTRLLTGRSPADGAPADDDALERAALALGLRRALPSLGRLGANLGLDELGLDSGSTSDADGVLVAGRQFGEDVLLRYRHGLFEDFAGLELIYRITERLHLRTETGTTQSIDLVYEVDPSDVRALRDLARDRSRRSPE